MPIIKSARKRVRVSRKAAARNAKTKRILKSALKSVRGKTSGDKLREAQSAIDVAAKKNVIHKNKAARKQRQLAAAAKAAGVKVTAKPKAAKTTAKPAAKPAAKKPAAKKPVAKKTAKK